jgi:hypothetical protein
MLEGFDIGCITSQLTQLCVHHARVSYIKVVLSHEHDLSMKRSTMCGQQHKQLR